MILSWTPVHFPQPLKKIVTCVHRLHVLKLDGLAQHHLIERPDEESVQELPMVDCHS